MTIDRTTLLKAADATLGDVSCRLLARLRRRAVADNPPAPVRTGGLRRVLVIRPGGVGDMIVLLPVLDALRRHLPGGTVDLVCEQRNLPVLDLYGMGDRALTYDRHPARFLRRLRRAEYDAVIDTEQFHHFSAVFGFLSGAPIRVGFKLNPVRNPLYTHLVGYSPDAPEGRQFMRLLLPLGLSAPEYRLSGILADRAPALPDGPAADLQSTTGGQGYVVIHAGSSTPFKLWPEERYAALGEALHRSHGPAIVLVGGRADARSARALAGSLGRSGCPVISLAGRLDLEATAAVIGGARLFVGGDSGLGHLAVALGGRTVVLFGPSDPVKWGHDAERHAVVHENLPCAPCFMFGYHKPCATRACMRQIGTETVLAACERVLQGG